MSLPPKPPVFLHRASYRQRRLRDAAKLVPFLGLMLWAIPLMWQTEEGEPSIGAGSLLYVFGVWLFLIVLTALLANWVRKIPEAGGAGDTDK